MFGIHTHTLVYIKQIINKNLLSGIGNYTGHFVITYKGKESEKNRYFYMYNSLGCMPEMKRIL